MCLDQGHIAVPPMRLEPTSLRFRDKHSTTEPLGSLYVSSKSGSNSKTTDKHAAECSKAVC